MTISGTTILMLLAAVLAVAVLVYARRYAVIVLTEVRKNFLTFHGFAVAVLWWCVVSGALSSYIVFQVQVLGNDVAVSTTPKGK